MIKYFINPSWGAAENKAKADIFRCLCMNANLTFDAGSVILIDTSLCRA